MQVNEKRFLRPRKKNGVKANSLPIGGVQLDTGEGIYHEITRDDGGYQERRRGDNKRARDPEDI